MDAPRLMSVNRIWAEWPLRGGGFHEAAAVFGRLQTASTALRNNRPTESRLNQDKDHSSVHLQAAARHAEMQYSVDGMAKMEPCNAPSLPPSPVHLQIAVLHAAIRVDAEHGPRVGAHRVPHLGLLQPKSSRRAGSTGGGQMESPADCKQAALINTTQSQTWHMHPGCTVAGWRPLGLIASWPPQPTPMAYSFFLSFILDASCCYVPCCPAAALQRL